MNVGLDNVQLAAPSATITATGVAPATVCAGSSTTVNFSYTGSPTSISGVLSNASGSFASGTTALTGTATTSGGTGSIPFTIPATVAGGTGYKIRVNASGVTGTGDQSLTINNVAVAPSGLQTISINTNGTDLVATETPAGNFSSREWFYGTTSGSHLTATGVTGNTYTPNFAAIGTYYVVAKSTFATCGPITSNEVRIDVTAPTPTITVSPTAALTFSTNAGTPSNEQFYTVRGDNLTADLTVTAPTGYEISLASGTYTGTGANTLTLTQTGGTVASTTIYVRMLGTGTGTVAGNITHISSGATTKNVALTGTIIPVITPSTAGPLTFATTAGTASAAQSYTVSGAGLTANILVTAPTGYEVSKTSATASFAATQTLTPTGGTVASTTIYVRMTGAGVGTVAGNVAHASTNATTQNVAVTGTITPVITTSTAGPLTFSTITGTASASQTYNVSGAGLGADLVLTAPAGYEISKNGTGGAYASSQALTPTAAGAVASTAIYVRLAASAPAGAYGTAGAPVQLTHTSPGAAQKDVDLVGTVSPQPVVSVTPAALNSFSTTQLTPSAAQSYTLSGTDLVGAVTVTAPSGYEVSQTSATAGFAPTQSVTAAAATTGLPIYVRLTGAAIGTFGTAGTPVNVTNASASATTKNVAVNGSVTTPPFLATYSMASTTGTAGSVAVTSKDPGISAAANLTRGSGISTSGLSNAAGLYGGAGWGTTATLTAAQTGNKFFAFAITPAFGSLANVSSVVANAYRTSTAPATVELLYSFSSDFSNPVSVGSQGVSGLASPGSPISFASMPTALQGVSSPIYFRLYGYSSTGGNFYFLDNGAALGLVVNGTTSPSPVPLIATGTVNPSAVCGGSDVLVNYATAGPASTGTYQVQLSDASGNFASPSTLATVSSTGTSLTVTVPASTASGTAYRVRVVNTDGTVGTASAAITVVSNPTATVAPAGPQTINVGTAGATLTVTETPAASRQWAFATMPGGPYMPIGGATGTTYAPTFATAGTYYVVAQSTFAACATVTSAEVAVTVTVPTLTPTPTSLTGFITNTGTGSLAQTYTLVGSGVTAPVTVTAPANFEVSLDGVAFAATVSPSAVAVNAGQTIYVRLTGGTQGNFSGNVLNAVGTTSVSVAVSGTVLTNPGLLLVEDDFDYTGALNTHGWTGTASSVTSAGNVALASYPQGVAATGATSYKASIDGNSGSSLFRAATVPAGTTAVYASALISVSSAENVSGNDYLFAFQSANPTSFYGRVTIAKVPSSAPVKFTFKIRFASSDTGPTVEATPTQFSVNTPYLLVMKMENSPATGNTDRFSLYVLPSGTSLSQEPSTPLLTINKGTNILGDVNGFLIREADVNNPTFSMDGFRFATGWGTVVGNPIYNAPTATVNPGSYYNVTTDNSSQPTQGGAVTVENQLALTSGKFDLNGQSLTLLGTVAGGGTLAGSATSSLAVLGTGALGTLTFAPGAQTLNNLTLNRTTNGSAVLGSPLTVNGALTLTSGALTSSSTSLLTLASAATVAPVLPASGPNVGYVDGPVARPVQAGTSATSFVFPVGKSSHYRPMTVNVASQANASTYTAEQIEGNPGQTPLGTGNGLGTAPLQRVSAIRSFNLSSSNAAANAAGTVALSFGTGDGVNDPADAGLVIAARNAAFPAWQNLSRSGFTGATTGAGGAPSVGTLTSAPISTLANDATFALGATNDISTLNSFQAINPLPVELSRFGAQRQADQAVAVSWTTASEKNAERFEVQRSRNARDFVTVATTKAQGTSSKATAYTVLDKSAPAGLLYYRLRQVDNDGTAAFSPVVTVAGGSETVKVLLYPNPTSTSISFIAEAATPYRVLNQVGQVLLQGTTEAGTAKVAVDKLPAGLYLLELQTPAGRSVQKFEKQ
ncbi:T9SS type A sorting domain-containing protein [Hymenobacter armeniacus]|uniref:T9SS type A sorting domain-containing protein n=1 Tax=Hymenobacter armeniacus TaxID=2771358 RepID=A0ABR8JV69_9BACT|nr:T9SS type A sorting domain-containing protein [Hymenobacter armeniacus]MBD2722417.1 T9SS type A sorting domain-containing protein [Hymenobacter armeniacus]